MPKRAQFLPSSISSLPLEAVMELFECVPEAAFFAKDRLGRYTAVNRSLLQRVGLKRREDLLGKSVREIFPPDLAECYGRQDEAVLRQGRAVRDQLELHWQTNRQRGWCLTTKLPLRDSAGAIIGLVGISRDVPGPGETSGLPTALAEAVDHLRQHFGEPISPSSLAQRAGLTPVRFARLTYRMFGLTPTQLIAQTRIQAAAEWLAEGKRSIAEIALSCGFTDHSAFTRAFRIAVGITPSAFRAQVRGRS
jgi:PAS domain S-box-containing protein